ncbi:Protein of unknown function [Gordonia malaquae]|uniref:DUF732 domain-containing protein n=1 Tax=Gordonia malaquae NBRC 108250 TaxID=1223542 RepID=M3TES2_GORML|nr:DUF732 domain-containing protein [Gordonia malaquae]GAC79931.1 hypothetical protein GM1_013_00670 [Gordonia malaquae NBRC 108250]SEB81664.1 Protein of unknown function [Gordonia malaquae]
MRARLLFIAPVIAGAAFLGACSDDGSSSDSTDRAAYLKALEASNITFANEDEAVAVGEQACADLKAGKSVLEVAQNIEGKDAGQGAIIVGAATGSFCRDQIGMNLPELSTIPGLPG